MVEVVVTRVRKAFPVQSSHRFSVESVVFDEPNLVSAGGLVPVLELAEQTGLSWLIGEHVELASTRVRSGAVNPAGKLTTIIAGMMCGQHRRCERAARRGPHQRAAPCRTGLARRCCSISARSSDRQVAHHGPSLTFVVDVGEPYRPLRSFTQQSEWGRRVDRHS